MDSKVRAGLDLGNGMVMAVGIQDANASRLRDEQMARAKELGYTFDEDAAVAKGVEVFERIIRSQIANLYSLHLTAHESDRLITQPDARVLLALSAFTMLGSYTHIGPDGAAIGLMEYVDSLLVDLDSLEGISYILQEILSAVSGGPNDVSQHVERLRTFEDLTRDAEQHAASVAGSNPDAPTEDLDQPARSAPAGRHDKVQGGNVHPGGRSFAD